MINEQSGLTGIKGLRDLDDGLKDRDQLTATSSELSVLRDKLLSATLRSVCCRLQMEQPSTRLLTNWTSRQAHFSNSPRPPSGSKQCNRTSQSGVGSQHPGELLRESLPHCRQRSSRCADTLGSGELIFAMASCTAPSENKAAPTVTGASHDSNVSLLFLPRPENPRHHLQRL